MNKSFYILGLLFLGLAYSQPLFSEDKEIQKSCEDLYFKKHILEKYSLAEEVNDRVIDFVTRPEGVLSTFSSTGAGWYYYGILGDPILAGAALAMPFMFTTVGTSVALSEAQGNQAYEQVWHVLAEAKMGDGFYLRALFNEMNGSLVDDQKFSAIENLADFILAQDSQLVFCKDDRTLPYNEFKSVLLEEKRKEK